MQCHYSYSACGLGSDGTDRLAKLVQAMQHSKSDDGTLYGAKITGGGSGGTVCVVGKNCLRSSQQIIEVNFFLFPFLLRKEKCLILRMKASEDLSFFPLQFHVE